VYAVALSGRGAESITIPPPTANHLARETFAMQQVKFFKNVENNLSELEKEVNAWISQSGVRIVSLTGNIAPQSDRSGTGGGLSNSTFPPSDVLVIVLYETST
jgi:hypothetical protein